MDLEPEQEIQIRKKYRESQEAYDNMFYPYL